MSRYLSTSQETTETLAAQRGPSPLPDVRSRSGRRAARALLVLAALLPAVVTATAASADTAAPRATAVARPLGLRLPEPTGHYRVGVRTDSVSDPARIDAQTGRPRRLPLRVWYPARPGRHSPAPYLSPLLQQAVEESVGAAPGAFAITTHAFTDAPAGPRPRGVILVQPGGGSVTAFQTGLVTDLASHGYTVVAMEIPHESAIVEEPDGQVIFGQDDWPFAERRLDAEVVLNHLAQIIPEARAGTPVGMFGHSRGGAATIDTMFHDPRISAGVSLDTGSVLFTGDNGLPPSDVVTAGLAQPLGLMCSLDAPCSSPQLIDFASHLHAPHPMRQLPILHNGYTDFVLFNPQAERIDATVAAQMNDDERWPTGTLDNLRAGAAAMNAQRHFLVMFFERYLTTG
jgi:dienelactone hydrolase